MLRDLFVERPCCVIRGDCGSHREKASHWNRVFQRDTNKRCYRKADEWRSWPDFFLCFFWSTWVICVFYFQCIKLLGRIFLVNCLASLNAVEARFRYDKEYVKGGTNADGRPLVTSGLLQARFGSSHLCLRLWGQGIFQQIDLMSNYALRSTHVVGACVTISPSIIHVTGSGKSTVTHFTHGISPSGLLANKESKSGLKTLHLEQWLNAISLKSDTYLLWEDFLLPLSKRNQHIQKGCYLTAIFLALIRRY